MAQWFPPLPKTPTNAHRWRHGVRVGCYIGPAAVYSGIRAEGSVYTGYTFFRKISAALAGFLPGIMLTQIGYVPNIAQSDATLQGLRQLIFIWPCALAIIAALTMGFFYTLNEKRFALIIEEINQRKNKEMATEEKTASVTL